MKNVCRIRWWLSFFIVISMITSLVIANAVTVYSADETEIIFGEAVGVVGNEVVVPVYIKNNPGIATFRFRITYNTGSLEFISIEKGSVLTGGAISGIVNENDRAMTFLWYSTKNVTGDGEIVLLRFKLSHIAFGEFPLIVTYWAEDLLNEKHEEIPYSVKNGKIIMDDSVKNIIVDRVVPGTKLFTLMEDIDEEYSCKVYKDWDEITDNEVAETGMVIKATDSKGVVSLYLISVIGDINGDGSISAVDSNLLKKIILGELRLDNEKLIMISADVDDDGTVNGRDSNIIKKIIDGSLTVTG